MKNIKKNMKKMILETLRFTMGCALGLITIILVVTAFASVWTEPTAPPPGANVPAPLNVGPNIQTKAGGLNIMGNVGIGTATPTSKLHVMNLPTFADNAAAIAGGLTLGAFYRTTVGNIKVVVVPVPNLHLTPITITGSLIKGTGWTNIGTVSVDNIGGGTLSWSATVGTAYTTWLEVIPPTTGTTTIEIDTVTIRANTTGLAVGTHTGTITFPGGAPATGSPDSVTVTLVVGAPPFACGGALTDPRDGQTYATVLIGAQCWMAENLNVGTMLASGGTMPNTTDNIIEKWCYNNSTTICASDGGLYHWVEATKDGLPGSSGIDICPLGWSIPTDAQFMTLEEHLGMCTGTGAGCSGASGWRGTDQGTQLKVGGTSGWNGLLTGVRNTDGSFPGRGTVGYFWSSSPGRRFDAWFRAMPAATGPVFRWEHSPAMGKSVRCLKN